MPFTFESTEIAGVIIATPHVFADARGFFLETYKKSDFAEVGIEAEFVQENHSKSSIGTLRGLHAQREPFAQGKHVRAVEGEIFDVVVDARADSSTFGRWIAVMLSADNRRSLYVPPGCLHGFCVVSDEAQVIYRTTKEYAPTFEYGVRWDDPDLAIAWPIREPRLSERDKGWPGLKSIR